MHSRCSMMVGTTRRPPLRAPRVVKPQAALAGGCDRRAAPCRGAASGPSAGTVSARAVPAAFAGRSAPRRSLRAAAAGGGGGQEGGNEAQEMPSEAERAEYDAAAAALVAKLDAAYQQMDPDEDMPEGMLTA